MSAAIECRKISKTYARGQQTVTVLKDLDLEIESGEFVALMGPSGSGKTTLLNLIAGLDSPAAGELRVGGERIDQLSGPALARWRARHIGFVFQFYNLLPALTAEQNVEVPLLLANLPKERRRKHVDAALQLVGLSDRAQHKPSELSGGQQQRVSIARAIVPDPLILVCDEPTGDLDRDSAEEVLELLRMLNERHGKTIVMVTHDPKAAEYASRQLHVDKGLLISPPSIGAAEYLYVADAVQLQSPTYGSGMPFSLAPWAATDGVEVAQALSKPAPAAEEALPQPATRIERSYNGRGAIIAGAAAAAVLMCAGTWYVATRVSTPATVRNVSLETNAAPAPMRRSAFDEYLELADRAFESAAYVTPKGVSAVDLYRKALAEDPTSAAAREGIRSVVDALLVTAERALLDQHFDAATQALEQAREVDSTHPHLDFVARQIERERERFEPTRESTTATVAAASKTTSTTTRAKARPPVEAAAESPGTHAPAATDSMPDSTSAPAPAPPALPSSQASASGLRIAAESSSPAPLQPETSASLPVPDALATMASNTPAKIDPVAAAAVVEPAAVADAPMLERIEHIAPVFPSRARALGLSGWVVVNFTVTADGRTADINVQRASPREVFDSAAIDAVNQWRYKPPLRDGRPASRRTKVKISFVAEK